MSTARDLLANVVPKPGGEVLVQLDQALCGVCLLCSACPMRRLSETLASRPNSITRLHVGQSKTFDIHASEEWNDTGLEVHPGEQYQLEADGTWVDLEVPCNPDGYSSFPLPTFLGPYVSFIESLRREPNTKWFSLVGCIDKKPEDQFIIDRHANLNTVTAGRLYCFANDLPGFYWNNWGDIRLTVHRVA